VLGAYQTEFVLMPLNYAEPLPAASLSECWFYHSIDLPKSGFVKGDWDLRGVVSAYLGNVDFTGKRALDVGAASGFLTFEMEKRGADVVSFDLNDGANWDVVPHYAVRDQLASIRAAQGVILERLKKSYWLSHRELGSNAKAFYGNIYDIPRELGTFDIVFYGMIVGHLRDVFHALYNGARLCSQTMIVTSMFAETEGTSPVFAPSPTNSSNLAIKHWWGLNIGTMRAMLGVLGFNIVDMVESFPSVEVAGIETKPKCLALVARRKS
jgi:hypothetical protein